MGAKVISRREEDGRGGDRLLLVVSEKRELKNMDYWLPQKKGAEKHGLLVATEKRSRKTWIIGRHRKKEPKNIDYWLPRKKGAEKHGLLAATEKRS
ncbi:hypothetical protein BHU16_04435 [Tannerella sp. oral taxon 808]|nr:hypothetical protein BHU16_04435 [Tannerella sp. oral taxon 808]